MAHLSRTPKIEDTIVAGDAVVASQRGEVSILSQLLSVTALSHAVSGSVGGNVAMLGQFAPPPARHAEGTTQPTFRLPPGSRPSPSGTRARAART